MTDAVLVLEDGRTFRGRPYGAEGSTLGEIVFNTGMTGYQETLTDPSYHRQVVVMTAPHIGNTGTNDEDNESRRMWVAGFIARDPARLPSNWRAKRSLEDDLRALDRSDRLLGNSGHDPFRKDARASLALLELELDAGCLYDRKRGINYFGPDSIAWQYGYLTFRSCHQRNLIPLGSR